MDQSPAAIMTGGGASTALRAPANPFVQQLIFQADSLHAVSRSVESLMKREGIPVLAATREFLDHPSMYAPAAAPARGGRQRSPATIDRPSPALPIDQTDRWSGEGRLSPNALRPQIPDSPRKNGRSPDLDGAIPPGIPEQIAYGNPAAREYDLDVAPFAALTDARIIDDAPSVEPPAALQAVATDHAFSDWSEPKNFHGNDHARAYDIDPALDDDDDVFAVNTPAATVSAFETGEPAEPAVGTIPAESGAVNAVPRVAKPAPAAPSPEAAPVKNTGLTQVLSRLASQYHKRLQAESAVDKRVDAALEEEHAAPAAAKRSIPGQIAHGYMVAVGNGLEIPKVPPYIWSAPELPWQCDDSGQDPFASWMNCSGNKFQLAFELDA